MRGSPARPAAASTGSPASPASPRQLRRVAGRHRQGRDDPAEIVVNAAGYRAGEIMALVGRHLPIVAMQHQYLVTEDIPAWSSAARTSCRCCATPTSPTICARSARASSSAPTSGSAAPSGGRHPGRLRLPALARRSRPAGALHRGRLRPRADPAEGGVKRVVNGPIPYAPDGNPYIGPAHGLTNFYQCCCFSFGIAQSAEPASS